MIGQVTFLNEADDGSIHSTVELDVDPSTLPTGLYPDVNFSAPVDVVTKAGVYTQRVEFLGMRLSAWPIWPDVPPVT